MSLLVDSSSNASEPLSNPPASGESSDIQAVLDREPARSIQILKRRASTELQWMESGSWTVRGNTDDCPSKVEGEKSDCQEVIYKVARGEARWLVLFESGTRGATRPYIKPLNAARERFVYLSYLDESSP